MQALLMGYKVPVLNLFVFAYNDIQHLETLLKRHAPYKSQIYIVVESIYSMDGDFTPLEKIVDLKKAYNAQLIVDEAHSIGLYGPSGNGWVSHQGLTNNIDILLLAFGKSFGLNGAMLASTSTIVERVKSKCRSHIYSTALPLPIVSGLQKACDIIQGYDDIRENLQSNIDYFKKNMDTESMSQIQPILLGKPKGLKMLRCDY